MHINRLASVAIIAATSFTAITIQEGQAQSAGGNDAEIALLKQQLRLLEQKLDKLQKQTAANTAAAANAKAEAKAEAKAAVASRQRQCAIPVKGPVAPSGVVVTMPNNRPTICTADEQNCVAITSRVHLDVGGYDYRPNTAATVPQKLDSGENVRRARIGVVGKFLSDWNFALIYDFGGSSDGFGGTAAGIACRAAALRESRTPISATPGSSLSAARWRSKAASWTCPTRSTKRRAQTTSCSWSAPPQASSRPVSRPATSARPSARAGTTTCSGLAPM